MNFDLKIEDGNLLVYSSYGLEEFSYKFIDYYKNNIDRIKQMLEINEDLKIIVYLTDNKNIINFPYGVSDFSGYFNNTGAFAYINLKGKKTELYMFKGLMHEIVHHIYKFYVYGKDKERITWVDEGLAQFISGQKEDIDDIDSYNEFLYKNLKNNIDINLNNLNHDDMSFGNSNGYNLSYIAIKYLYEISTHKEFIGTIKNADILKK